MPSKSHLKKEESAKMLGVKSQRDKGSLISATPPFVQTPYPPPLSSTTMPELISSNSTLKKENPGNNYFSQTLFT